MPGPRPLKESLYVNFLVAALLPIVIVSLLVLYYLTNQTLQSVAEKNLLLARTVSGKIEVLLREPRGVLEGVDALLRSGGPISPEVVGRMLDSHVRSSEIFESIYILGPEGKVENVGLPLDKAGFREDFIAIDLSHLDFFEEARRTGRATWSDTFLSLLSGKISLALAVPMDERILVGNLNLDILGDFVRRVHAGERVSTIIVDRSGAIIVHHDPAIEARQVNIGHLPLIRSGLAGTEETRRYTFLEEEYLGSVSPISGPAWVAVASQRTEDAYRPVRASGLMFLAGAVGATLLAVLLAYARARKLSQPLSEFTQRATAVADGRYDVSFSGSHFLELEEIAGSFLRMVSAVRERERQLLESRERYRSLVDKINDGMGVLDHNGRFVYVNPRLAEMLGYRSEELLTRPAEDFLGPRNRDLFRRYCRFQETKSRDICELEWVCADGSRLHTIFSPQPISKGGAYGGCVAVITDITTLKRAQQLQREAREQVEQARDQLDAVLKSVADGLVVTDLDGRIILMNVAAGELLCISASEALGRPLRDAVAEDKLWRVVDAVLTKEESFPAIDLEMPCGAADNRQTIQVRTSLARNKEEQKIGVIMLFRDVTRERQIGRMKDEFISTVAHEFRTPLTSIQGFSQVLLTQEGLSDRERKEFLTYIHERSIALAGIVASLLDIARIRAGRPLALNCREWSVGEVFGQVTPYLKTQAARHRVELEIAAEETRLRVDREKIGQVLENLLSNAVKYSPPGSMIRLLGEFVPSGYRIAVIDQGIGMNEEEVERVFDKFYRVDASDSAVEGVGLGMSIVKMIVEQHGGRIRVASEPGKGTTVSFLLPLSQEPSHTPAGEARPARSETAG